MTVVYNSDVTSPAVARLLEQFKGSPKIEGLITAIFAQMQDVEDQINQVATAFDLGTAVGEQLNVLGRVVGQPRGSLSDADYTLWILARIIINRASGTAEEIYKLLRLILMDIENLNANVVDQYPLSFRLTIANGIGAINPDTIFDIINEVRVAGVGAELVYVLTDDVFRFDSGPGWDQGHLAGLKR